MWTRNKSRKTKREGSEGNTYFAQAGEIAVQDSRPVRSQFSNDLWDKCSNEIPPEQGSARMLGSRRRAQEPYETPHFENLRIKGNQAANKRREMDQKSKNGIEKRKAISKEELLTSCSEIRTAQDFARFMATMMAALIAGEIDAATGNAICKAASNILKAIEMQIKFGKGKPLNLTDGEIPSLMPVKTGEPTRFKPQPEGTNGRRKWCQDCYIEGNQYIQATKEEGDDPLCEMHYKKRIEEYS